MNILKKVAVMALIAISFNVNAQNQFIKTLDSTDGESVTQFVVRSAKVIQEWTNKNNAEICGWIQINEKDQYRINLVTDYSQVFCMLKFSKIDEGYMNTREYIHSHPNHDRNFIVETTKATESANKHYGFEHELPEFYVVKKGFSNGDYQVRGWLVDNGNLWYQTGKGTETNLGNINKL